MSQWDPPPCMQCKMQTNGAHTMSWVEARRHMQSAAGMLCSCLLTCELFWQTPARLCCHPYRAADMVTAGCVGQAAQAVANKLIPANQVAETHTHQDPSCTSPSTNSSTWQDDT